jgi:hypothetical protein
MKATRRAGYTARFAITVVLAASVGSAPVTRAFAQPLRIPDRLDDREFWSLINGVSEAGGSFRSDNFLSNERMFQVVIPRLQRITRPGGIYLGVGPEQNFTYIVALQPRMAIIFDIRRQNMIEHLMYKALFELSPTRAEFLSKLFCRPRFAGDDTVSDVGGLMDRYGDATRDSLLARRTLASIKQTLVRHGFMLTAADLASLDYVFDAFCTRGPDIDYSYPSQRGGFGRGMPSYAELMLATDSAGTSRSYLATEANYRYMRSMHARNLIVPVVGDFAGPKAIRTVAQYLKRRGATVTAFYTSNVEQYLFQQADDWQRFYENVETLPIDQRSMFIRSIGGGARGLGSGRPFGRLGSVLSSIQEILKAYRDGRINAYGDVIGLSR